MLRLTRKRGSRNYGSHYECSKRRSNAAIRGRERNPRTRIQKSNTVFKTLPGTGTLPVRPPNRAERAMLGAAANGLYRSPHVTLPWY